MSHSISSDEINFYPIDYENHTFEEFYSRNEFDFIRKHKSLYHLNSFEFDVCSKKLTDAGTPFLFILRTPICKIVYFNKNTNKAIFQISNPTNKISEKFIIFVNDMQEKYEIHSDFHLIKHDQSFNNYSLILEMDLDGFAWFDRLGVERDQKSIEKPNVVGILYLDKKILVKGSEHTKQKIGFRWRLYQLREMFLGQQKCMIKLKTDPAESASNFVKDDIFVPFPTVSALPQPPIPPPPPPVFKIAPKIIIKKKELINRLKKETNQNFVVSQDELIQVLKRMKSKELLY